MSDNLKPAPKKVLKPAPTTPKASEKANTPSKTREVTLPSGRIVQCIEAKGKHVVEAQRLMAGDPDMMLPALITVCSLFDGKKIPMEDVLELPYMDYMALLGEFQGAF